MFGYSDQAISWAFENWNRNGEFFPKPTQIMALLQTHGTEVQNQTKFCDKCNGGWVIVNPDASPADYKVVRCQCVEDAIAAQKVATHVCDDECKRRHGRGYGTNDMLWLFKKRMASSVPWTEEMYESALRELDGKREQGKPAWR